MRPTLNFDKKTEIPKVQKNEKIRKNTTTKKDNKFIEKKAKIKE